MGGGISSLSKICVVAASEEPNTVDFSFAQVGIKDMEIDMHGTCGNLMSAVPLFAVQEGLVTPKVSKTGQLEVLVNCMNTQKKIMTQFPGSLDTGVDWHDLYEVSGVDGYGTRVATEYLDCGGSKTGQLWPTGNFHDTLVVDGKPVRATLIDGPNPAIFCDAQELGFHDETLETLTHSPAALKYLEKIRIAGTIGMGIARDDEDARQYRAVPKISLLQRPLGHDARGIRATTLSMEVPHKAIPITIALSLSLAMATPGSIPSMLATGKRIYHPTGFVDIDANVHGASGASATVIRSVKRLMKGEIFL